ncbi:MAG: hypothetical protein ABSA59_22255 [Terriglobia bacterium]
MVRWGQQVLACVLAWDASAPRARQAWPVGVAQRWGDGQARSRRADARVAQFARACWAAAQEQRVVERVALRAEVWVLSFRVAQLPLPARRTAHRSPRSDPAAPCRNGRAPLLAG